MQDLEDLLPPEEQTKWAEKMDSYTAHSRYEKFNLFLRERRAVEEKKASIGSGLRRSKSGEPKRKDKASKCSYCSEKHDLGKYCKARKDPCSERNLCWSCLKPRHKGKCEPAGAKGGKGTRKKSLGREDTQ